MEAAEALERALEGVEEVIHLGAGTCRELPYYLASPNRRVLLVEANPRTARRLQSDVSGYPNVSVLQAAVAGDSGDAILRVFNLADRSSLRNPTKLLQQYPGLRVVQEVRVTARLVFNVMADFGLARSGRLCVVIDTPGEELSILRSMVPNRILERISSIVLYCPSDPMYEGAATRTEIIEFLDAQGFEVLDDCQSNCQPVLTVRRSRWKYECFRLQEKVSCLRNELEGIRQRLTEETEEMRREIREKDVEIKAAVGVREVLRQKNEELSREQNRTKKLERELEVMAADLQKLRRHLKSKEAELDEARQNLRIAMRMQMLRENDLRELQQRYSAVRTLKNRQEELLLKLHEKLSIAAESLEQIRQSGEGYEDVFGNELVEHFLRALVDRTELPSARR